MFGEVFIMATETVQVEEIEDENHKTFLSNHSDAFPSGYYRYQPFNQILPKAYLNQIQEIRDFKVRDDDIWICSLPKAGTTWTQETVWCIMNNLDFKKARETILDERVPYLELVWILFLAWQNLLFFSVYQDLRSCRQYLKK